MIRLLLVVGMLAALAVNSAEARPWAELPLDAVVVGESNAADAGVRDARSQAKAVESLLAKEGPSRALAALAIIDDALAFETAADALVRGLQMSEDSDLVRSTLEALSNTPTRVFKRHDETRADWFVPVFDVGASARYALRSLREIEQRLLWGERLSSDPNEALETLKESENEAIYRAAESIANLKASEVARLSRTMLIQPEQIDSALWRSLALRSDDVAVFAAAASYCSDQDLLGLLGAVMRLPADDATYWLINLSSRPQLASAALLALVPLAEAGSGALDALISGLDSEDFGATSAAALAKRPQGDRLPLISQLIAETDASPRRLQSLALALRLEGSPEASVRLRALGQDHRLSLALRAELSR